MARPSSITFMANIQRLNPGFTLIELTVVIFLLGLLYLTAMPKVTNFLYHSDLKGVARSIKATVHLLRSKSIVTHKNTALHFDLDRHLYWGDYENSNAEIDFSARNLPLVSPRKLPEGIRFLDVLNLNQPKKNFGLLRSGFNPKGVVEETVIHLADSHGGILTIIINAFTGRFLIYDKYVDVEYE